MHTVKVTTLANGLRVATIPDQNARTATVMVLVGVGSSYETATENGLSHFLEHMCFKGTERRPNAKVLTEEIESLGAITNAFTDREFTGYFIKGNPEHVPQFVDILADIYQHSIFPEAEIEKEKGVVIEEINMYEDMPQQKVGDVLFAALYPNQPAGRSILGTKETVRALTRADLYDYKRRFYVPVNTVIVFSGKITHTQAVALSRKHYGTIARGSIKRKQRTVEVLQLASSVYRKPSDQAHFALAFRSVPMGHKDIPAVRMLTTVLGRGMSSRLSLLLREELGAAYYVYAQQDSYLDHGFCVIAAGIDRSRLTEVLSRIVDECKRIKEELITNEELAKAKEYSVGTMRLGLELSDDVAMFYGIQLVLRQKLKSPEELTAQMHALTPRDLMRVAKRVFSADRVTFALVGPYTAASAPVRKLRGL